MFLILISLISSCSNCNSNRNAVNYDYEKEIRNAPPINSCDETTAGNIGKLYHISSALYVYNNWSELESLVNNNKMLLAADSKLIMCMKNAGEKMQITNMQNFDPNAGNQAYERSVSMGATPDMARDIKSNVEQGQIQLFVIGQELVWLSKVLPEAAKGNWGPFLNNPSFYRKTAIDQIKLTVTMLGVMGEREILSYFINAMAEYQPYMEYQTAVMVYWFSN